MILTNRFCGVVFVLTLICALVGQRAAAQSRSHISASADGLPHAQVLSTFASEGEDAEPPTGWIGFCARYAHECGVTPSIPREVEINSEVWDAIIGANEWVNQHIEPMADIRHWGVIDKWDYPEDGFGDCEDYALLKRRILMEVRLPREALLMTVVWDKYDEGHSVLTVRTNKGDYILDNQTSEVLLWSKTTYNFAKRQSQSDPNRWIYIANPVLRSITSVSSSSPPPPKDPALR